GTANRRIRPCQRPIEIDEGAVDVLIGRDGASVPAGPGVKMTSAEPTIRHLEPLRHVEAGVLDIAYYEAGPPAGPVAMLLHGFPYDIHSFVDVAPMLA